MVTPFPSQTIADIKAHHENRGRGNLVRGIAPKGTIVHGPIAEVVRANQLKRSRTYRVRHPERTLFFAAQYRARQKGLSFTIKVLDIVIPQRCPILGLKLVAGQVGGRFNPNAPSLDRIDSRRGYEPDNIAVISRRANHLKNDGTADELEKIAAWMKGKEK